MKKLKFYKCMHCGNVVIKLHDCKVPVFCCGEKMVELVANTNDGAVEKHKPILNIDGNLVKVSVGEVMHPMTEEHYISVVLLQTNKGYYVKNLEPNEQPTAQFALLDDEKIINAYAYCNLHSLWID